MFKILCVCGAASAPTSLWAVKISCLGSPKLDFILYNYVVGKDKGDTPILQSLGLYLSTLIYEEYLLQTFDVSSFHC